MQNNVTELTQKLLKSLDDNYNVIDMPTVIQVISLLEKVAITKELLETTRLGKHVNELRRRTNDDGLSRRAKELVKKWRNMVLPDATNGQVKGAATPVAGGGQPPPSGGEDVNLNVPLKAGAKKRSAKDPPDIYGKRQRVNGMSEYDFSDNSNSSFNIDGLSQPLKQQQNTNSSSNLIIVNSDSNSSMPEKSDPLIDQQMPKKRGRKKGSKNHKNLLDEAETSFTNKLAVSRGMSKVKTTKELIAGLQNKTNSGGGGQLSGNASAKTGSREDLNEKAAKLTERVSIIDQKLNTNSNRYKSPLSKSRLSSTRPDRIIESGSVINDKSLLNNSSADEDIIVVDDVVDNDDSSSRLSKPDDLAEDVRDNLKTDDDDSAPKSLSVEECLSLLPPVDKSFLTEVPETICTCFLKENKPDFSVCDDENVNTEHTFEFIEDRECPARDFLSEKYRTSHVDDARVHELHRRHLAGVNGNVGLGAAKPRAEPNADGLYSDVRPNAHHEFLAKDPDDSSDERTETSFDEAEVSTSFREWFDVCDRPSYGGEPLRILPYVIID